MENENIVKETALSVAKETVKEVYADTVQPTAKNVGVFFGTLSGFFNHVVMYPLKKLNIKYEQKAIAFEKEMEKKYYTPIRQQIQQNYIYTSGLKNDCYAEQCKKSRAMYAYPSHYMRRNRQRIRKTAPEIIRFQGLWSE